MTKRNRRPSAPLSRAAFEPGLTKVVNGVPDADENVRAFFDDMWAALGIEVAVARFDGIEVLHRRRGDRRCARTPHSTRSSQVLARGELPTAASDE